MRRLLILSVAATICMQMGGCPSMGSIRSDRGSRNEVVYSNQAISFDSNMEYYVSGDGNMVNGIVSNGNGITGQVIVPSGTESTDATNSTESTTPASDGIISEWVAASRNDKIISVSIYSFYADGTYAEQYIEYTHVSYSPELFGENQTGWQGVPMGFPFYTGTYTVEGDTITMSCTSDSIEVFDSPIVSTMKIVSLGAENGIFSFPESGKEKVYLRDFPTRDPFVEDLCNALGIDTTP